jgi:hypothetical protein
MGNTPVMTPRTSLAIVEGNEIGRIPDLDHGIGGFNP